jgi:hypothetical protein
MGLLCSGDSDFIRAKFLCQELIFFWDEHFKDRTGYIIRIDGESVSQICLLAQEHIFSGKSLPLHPGPFKRAAAFCLLFRQFVDVEFVPLNKGRRMSQEESVAWRSRLAALSIPMVLGFCIVKGERMKKRWRPATDHLKGELLNWLRWMDPPLEEGAVRLDRVLRSILVFAMLIEQSYYITDSEIVGCDVMGTCVCEIDPDDPVIGPDLWIF